MNTKSEPDSDAKPDLVLSILSAVQEKEAITQREIARKMSVALGLANTYLRRCINKGYIKVVQAPANRYAYYLTPKGFTEKSRLTAQYLSQSLSLFKAARTQSEALIRVIGQKGWKRVALAGTGELSEIFILCLNQSSVQVAGIYDPEAAPGHQAGHRVESDLARLAPFDGVVVTDLRHPQQCHDQLAAALPSDKILALPLLGIVADTGARE